MSISNFNEIVKSDIETGTGEILEDYSSTGRKRNWSQKKKVSLAVFELYQKANEILPLLTESRLQQLRDCANDLIFATESNGKKKLVSANFCRVRMCEMCNWRKSLKLFIQISQITDKILADKKCRFLFVTLTMKNPVADELTNTIDKMNKAFSYLVNKNRTFAPAKLLKINLLGYMKSLEITYNSKTDTYHPHIHCIFELKTTYFKDGYITHKDWVSLWRQALNVDYDPLVNVKAIKNNTAKSVAEIAKYPVKSADVLSIKDKSKSVTALITLHYAMFKRRLITFGGDFKEYRRKLKLDDIEEGDLTHIEADNNSINAIAYTLFRYNAKVGAYIC